MTDPHQDWLACMRRGDFSGAWAVSAAVLARQPAEAKDDPTLPYHQRWVWNGLPFEGRHVLVRCYHGLGDTLQFARYLPRLALRAASITLECQPALLPLLDGLPGLDRLIAFDPAAPAPAAERDVEIMELAFALRLEPGDAPLPPLRVPQPTVLPPGTLGLCWTVGNWDKAREVSPALLRPLAEKHPCVSLVPGPSPVPCLNPEGSPADISATAALLLGTSHVVTVDTMVAHLAGTLGHPVSLMLKHDADWRWMAGRADSPWYPAMRLYRQPTPGDWASVVAAIAADLSASG